MILGIILMISSFFSTNKNCNTKTKMNKTDHLDNYVTNVTSNKKVEPGRLGKRLKT